VAAGSEARIGRRSLRDRGITDRGPRGHGGPAARWIAAGVWRSTKLRRIEEAREAARAEEARTLSGVDRRLQGAASRVAIPGASLLASYPAILTTIQRASHQAIR
jgi:hypothetical protein